MDIEGFPGGLVVKNLPANAGTWVQSLAWEDATCHGATKPMCLLSPHCRAREPQLLKPTHLVPICFETREAPALHSWRKACVQQWTQDYQKFKKVNKSFFESSWTVLFWSLFWGKCVVFYNPASYRYWI